MGKKRYSVRRCEHEIKNIPSRRKSSGQTQLQDSERYPQHDIGRAKMVNEGIGRPKDFCTSHCPLYDVGNDVYELAVRGMVHVFGRAKPTGAVSYQCYGRINRMYGIWMSHEQKMNNVILYCVGHGQPDC